MAHADLNEELAAWMPRLREIARPFTGRAEEDDLVQMGLIFVWQSLEKDEFPTDHMIRNTMRMWCRTLRRQEQGRNERLPNEDW